MTLSRRLLLLMLAVLLPSAALFVWIVGGTYLREAENEDRHVRETVRALALVVDRELDKRAAVARTLAASHALDEGDHRRFHAEAQAATQATDDWVVLVDIDNELIDTSVPFGTPLPRRAWRPDLGLVTGAPQVTNLHLNPLTKAPVLVMFAPVPNVYPPHFNVGVAFTPAALQAILRQQELPRGWQAAVIDRDNVVVAHTQADIQLARRARPELVRAVNRLGEGAVDLPGEGGAMERTYFSRSPLYGWTFVIGVPRASISSAARRAALQAAGGAAFLGVLAVVLATWGAGRIRKPIQALEQAARDLAAERVPQLQPTGLAEVDEVGAALHRAGVQAAQINDELERRVAVALKAAQEAQARHEALQRVLAEELLALITDHLPVLISYVDREMRYRLNNRAYERWFGRPRSDITGRLVSEVSGEDNWQKMQPRLAEALRGNPVAWEERLHYPAMGPRWVEVNYVPHRGKDGRVEGVAILVHDITARREANEELQRLNAELARAHRRKDEFLATLAHELRNPLAPITNALELLRLKNAVQPEGQTQAQMIERQVRQLTRLVDDLLDVARINRGRIDLRREPVEVGALCREAALAARAAMDAGGHQLSLLLPEHEVWLDADPTRIAQVLLNLLHNAAKYTPHGGQVVLAAAVEDGQAVLRVRDNGIGLAPEHLASVFEMFSQVVPALERAQGGLGIGLALVRGLVHLHGGRIEAHSAGPGQGSEFVVRLPLGNAPVSRPAVQATPPAPLTPLRVMVVDDNRDAALSLAELLELGGHQVEVAHSGEAALALAQQFAPQLCLLDIGMPGMNGYELAERLRAAHGTTMRLAALTGWGQQEDKRQAMKAGFDHHLTKPIDGPALEDLLAEVASEQRTGRAD